MTLVLFLLKEVKPSPDCKMVTLLKLDNLFPSLKSVVEWRRQPLTMAIAFSRQNDAAAGSHAYHSVFSKSRSRRRPRLHESKGVCYLCGYSNRTCIQVTFSHHSTSQGNKRSSRESKLVGTQESSNHNITSCAYLSINLQDNSSAKIV